jgi:GT2 family glycosyltransferase
MISVVIPVYKNTEQLVENLRQKLPFFKGCEVILVNDDPSKSIKKELSEFKEIILHENDKNLGFGQNVNKGVSFATHPYILLLNTDVVLHDDSFKTALTHFEKDKELFGVSFAQKERDGRTVGKNLILWSRGMYLHRKAYDLSSGKNGWAEGGTALIDKKKFHNLGGFDSLYTPFYWEDIDISYRAWKAGYTVLYDNEVVMDHHHEGTTGKYFMKDTTKRTAYRNQLIFIWKNITDRDLLTQHLLLLLPNLVYYVLLKKDIIFLQGFFEAVKRLGEVLKHRATQIKQYTKTDKEVLKNLS